MKKKIMGRLYRNVGTFDMSVKGQLLLLSFWVNCDNCDYDEGRVVNRPGFNAGEPDSRPNPDPPNLFSNFSLCPT